MEKYKLRYLQRFLRRKMGINDVESCINAMNKLKNCALACYDDIELEGQILDGNIVVKFSEMLLLDGCFVIEYIREHCKVIPFGEERIIKRECIRKQLKRDLLLVENQLPFFVLTTLHDMSKEDEKIPFINMVKHSFSLSNKSFVETEGNDEKIKHLFQLVHMCMSCRPSKVKTRQIRNRSLSGVSFTHIGNIFMRSLDRENDNDLGGNASLFDINFENGLMTIPCFRVVDDIETLMRNLIAYEQQSSDVHLRYFSDFAVFMDYLIDSDKNVSLLRMNGIIVNKIGDDKEVANFFNKIGKGIVVSADYYYEEECRKAVQYCEKPLNRIKANFRHNYFNTPWAGISTLAAIILLLLTVTQTVLSFLSTLKK
ncbi:hypothetical protein R3W88_011893 [Solanum pinnatisectum]|uniref:Uncharacterized protein n=1 Tax=Solanum pinnatisectum TaxID=50273 RepID=A0AAV9L7F3_9SOLN|nr:hypothetical protein R3W88_011893 [Solanum pinnatisectum]